MEATALPLETQAIGMMALRFEFALEHVYREHDPDDTAHAPGLKREHVFDFEDGMRLIVSRDHFEEHGLMLHVSSGIWRNDRRLDLSRPGAAMGFVTWTMGNLNKIADRTPRLRAEKPGLVQMFMMESGSLHLFFREEEQGSSSESEAVGL